MILSFWEKRTWFQNLDLIIVGSGMVGLTTAIFYKKKYPLRKVIILERGVLPYGASTRNAGFACFGSPSEILDDLKESPAREVFSRVESRYQGFQHLLELLGEEKLGYSRTKGFELFRKEESQLLEECKDRLSYLNDSLKSIFPTLPFSITSDNERNSWNFSRISESITLEHEGQIDTGETMFNLLKLAQSLGVLIVNGVEVHTVEDYGKKVEIDTSLGIFYSSKVAICTNGFAQKLLHNESVVPARAQVFISAPIAKLPFKGIFHLHQGYYYFRNVGDRVLVGGGRHLFRNEEQSFEIQTTASLQKHLKEFTNKHILKGVKWEIADSWAGIMGFGAQNEKGQLVKKVSDLIVCGVRLGGMGIAIGTNIGQKTADLLED